MIMYTDVQMYMCTYICIYVHTAYVYIYTVYVYVYMCVRVCVQTYMLHVDQLYMPLCMHACMHVYVCMYVCVYVCM